MVGGLQKNGRTKIIHRVTACIVFYLHSRLGPKNGLNLVAHARLKRG
jgi:hypothetical protein